MVHEATLDSSLLITNSEITRQKAEQLSIGDLGLSTDDLVKRLESYLSSDSSRSVNTAWRKMGRAVYAGMSSAPTVDFVFGPLSIERKERAQRQKSTFKKTTVSVARPDQLEAQDLPKSENLTTMNIASIYKILLKLGKTDMIKFITNPQSFSQTMENIFYLSFLVRDGRVKIYEDDNGMPIVEPVSQQELEKMEGLQSRQKIIEFDMQTWKDIIQVYNLKEPMIPHRKPSVGLGASKWY